MSDFAFLRLFTLLRHSLKACRAIVSLFALAAVCAASHSTPSEAATMTFSCITNDDGSFRQPWTVPAGVTVISAIPCSHQYPKTGGEDDAEVISDRIAKLGPFPGDFVA